MDERLMKPVAEKSLRKEPKQKSSINSKKDSDQSFIKIEDPSVNSSKKESEISVSGKNSHEINDLSNLSEPQ
jgi:hypothetical protein